VFSSILTANRDDESNPTTQAPEYFRDLNLDQIVETIVAGYEEYDLRPFFFSRLSDSDAIAYRQEVMRDVERDEVRSGIVGFAKQMREVRRHLALSRKLHYVLAQQRWFVHAAQAYGEAIEELDATLRNASPASRGLSALLLHLQAYRQSASFRNLLADINELTAELARIEYCVLIDGNTVTVRRYEGEENYSRSVAETFAKFRPGAIKDYRAKFISHDTLNHIEERILSLVAQLFPTTFAKLGRFCDMHRSFIDPAIGRFDREVQFYVAYVAFMNAFRSRGLDFAYPSISQTEKFVRVDGAVDLALAAKAAEPGKIVRNDILIEGRDRVLVVSGPNQGGKTTFSRIFGQIHHLASIGCPIAGSNPTTFLFDSIFTHFEREETIENLRGKLQDDLVRIHRILDQATSHSIIILNEIFTSTSLRDASYLGREILERIIALDALCVCVTFLTELASLADSTVSLVAAVAPDDPTVRTYKIVRRTADGRSYALSLADKYGLNYEQIKQRIAVTQSP
jgi:DNA mismatch repair protein MutS